MRHFPRRMARDSVEEARRWAVARAGPERRTAPTGGRGVGLEDSRQRRGEGAAADRGMAAALAGQVGCAGRVLAVLIVAAVVRRRGFDAGRRLRHRAAGGRHHARQRLRRKGERDQQSEKYPERAHTRVWAGAAGPVKARQWAGRSLPTQRPTPAPASVRSSPQKAKSIAASGRGRYSAASRTLPIGARFSYPDLTIPYSSASIGVATSATGRRRKKLNDY